MVTKKILATTLCAIIGYFASNGVLAASVQLAAGDLASPSKTLLANGLNGEGGKLASALSLSSRQKASLETALAEIRMKTPTKTEVNQEQYIEGQIKARMEAEKLLNATLTATQRSLLNLLQQKSGVKSLSSALNNVKAVESADNCSDIATQELTVEYVEPQVITVYLEEPEVQEITVYLQEPDAQEITVYLTPLSEKESAVLERGKAASAADKSAATSAVDRGKAASTTTSTSSTTDKAAASAGAGAAADRGKASSTTTSSSSTTDKAAASAGAGAAADRGKVSTTTTSTSSTTDKAAASAGASTAADRGKATSTTTSGDKATASVGAADRSKAAATTSTAEKLSKAASASSTSKAQAALQTAAKK